MKQNTQEKADEVLQRMFASVQGISRACRYAHWQTIKNTLKKLNQASQILANIQEEMESFNKN